MNNGVSSSQALARTLLLSGQQRLYDLLDAAPRLQLQVERVFELCQSSDAERTPEETAAQALVELCLGLMLQWMAERARQHRSSATSCTRQRVLPSYFPFYPSRRPPRMCSCLTYHLA